MDIVRLQEILKPPFWVTSDHHFHHVKIGEYEPCRPPDCDHVMLERWNQVVAPTDIVFHLGDIALGKKEQFELTARKLNGRIFLLRGNHDRTGPAGDAWYRSLGFTLVPDPFKIDYRGWTVSFAHRPDHTAVIESRHLHVHGHTHSRQKANRKQINVCVECTDFRPVRIEQLLDQRIKEIAIKEACRVPAAR